MMVRLRYRQELIRTYLLPMFASFFMFIVTVGVNALVTYLIRDIAGDPEYVVTGMANVVRLIICMIVAVITYALLVLKLGIAREKEILMMPKGATLVRIFKKLNLIHEHEIINRRKR